jgi:hypothetical protein
MVSTHGCTFALTAGDALAAPILDYEQPVPPEIDRQFQAEAPAFAEGFTQPARRPQRRRHIYLREQLAPEMFRQADAILNYPQFWNWLLTGAKVSEISSIGCHSHLWRPREDTFSSLVDKRGWRAKFPPFRRAGDVLGEARIGAQSVPVHNGVHDSNAALYYYRSLGYSDVTLISTGTWVITFNQACPLDALDPERDMLANVTVDRSPIPTARFMGGREYDVIAGRGTGIAGDLQRAIDRSQFSSTSFAAGVLTPAKDSWAPSQQCEHIATLYVALMMDVVLDQHITSRIVLDGGLTGTRPCSAPSPRCRPNLHNVAAEGTAMGAAALALGAHGNAVFAPQMQEANALALRAPATIATHGVVCARRADRPPLSVTPDAAAAEAGAHLLRHKLTALGCGVLRHRIGPGSP